MAVLMRVLVVNAGSSSLKLSVLDADDKVVAARTIERWTGGQETGPIREFLSRTGHVDAVGHRVVHGGPRFTTAVTVDDSVLAELESTAELAPLHNPRAVAAIRAVRRLLPDTAQVACFDTGFHATMPAPARTYALPREWNERWGLRRYGFHGLSHAYAVRRAAELVDRPLPRLRMVSCHLGAGCSLAAVSGGRSVDTTMGFTPLAGLVMVTRSGSVDPGLLLWLLRHGGLTIDDVEEALEHRSGLAGLSGTSGDLRDVLAARAAGDPYAGLAFDVFVHRLAREAAAMTAATGGLDVLVLTGGIGEHVPLVRAAVVGRLGHLGVAVDEDLNARATGDADISARGAGASTVVVTAREDVEIARQTRAPRPDAAQEPSAIRSTT
jgi:acetate kinase